MHFSRVLNEFGNDACAREWTRDAPAVQGEMPAARGDKPFTWPSHSTSGCNNFDDGFLAQEALSRSTERERIHRGERARFAIGKCEGFHRISTENPRISMLRRSNLGYFP
jgi:hypothetical protein